MATPPSERPTQTQVTVRRADTSDLPAVAELLSVRDGRPYPLDRVAAVLSDLSPDLCRVWLASADGVPAGITGCYVRRLRWGGVPVQAGYWGLLFVHPDRRQTMAYAQLVLAMFRDAAQGGLELVYTATRRQEVVRAHVKMGCRELGTLSVLAKPLRPGRLVARHKQLGRIAETLAALFDSLYAWPSVLSRRLTRSRPGPIEQGVSPPASASGLLELLDQTGEGHTSQAWSTESLEARLRCRFGGKPYTILGVRDGPRQVAALVHTAAEGEKGVLAGVVMAVACAPGHECEARSLLVEAEAIARGEGCDVMLYLDGLGEGLRRLVTGLGYRRAPYAYSILVWPAARALPGAADADLGNWRFSFLDHDAF
jgi:N-acetylglutamate synthase-like GNAT family acetyltransferase